MPEQPSQAMPHRVPHALSLLGWLALANILLLDALVVATMLAFHRVRPLAAALLIPYLVWIAFATALTFSTWTRNPTLLG